MAEELIFALWGIGDLHDAQLTQRLVAAGAESVRLNVSDADVADAMLRLTTFDAPIEAVLALSSPTACDLNAVLDALGHVSERHEGWRVEVRTPLPPPSVAIGERTPGLANVAFLRRPPELPYDEWLARWRNHHTEVAITTQATFGYVQNRVLEPVTDAAPDVAAVVEELFPSAALHDPHAFYGTGGDPAELNRRIQRMMASVATFGADRDIDVVPTSRYVLH
ncbi:EthD domain-containing protein [Nocardia amikacinitolerans]|uniref:EthD domain-containing protein n=1 Tax=Nocardia amikacinitolerans TaxID=756689 RepID=A0A285LXE3_9NOCA|nr:EthD domain-containing protein [Nocardia amikacinitolerans]SNY89582.1 EthD domain-containing protein [Nocardia amikacinitolerans]